MSTSAWGTAMGLILSSWAAAAEPVASSGPAAGGKTMPIPVIFDTDIGDDIDDLWALALILGSPELDLKLVVTDARNTESKAKLTAKFLDHVGRSGVPVGIGVKKSDERGPYEEWGRDYELERYPGKIHRDGVQALIDEVMGSPRPITIVAVGPVPNLAEALQREPRIARRARLVLMGGSIDRGYGDKPGRCAEYNVRKDAPAAQAAYMADWPVTLAPLDTAGIVRLSGESYARVRDADTPVCTALMENYRMWAGGVKGHEPQQASSILFDTVAVYLAFDETLCRMKEMTVRVTDKGFTEPDPAGRPMRIAMQWNDLEAFHRLLAERIAGAR